jgi:hypothetical protein
MPSCSTPKGHSVQYMASACPGDPGKYCGLFPQYGQSFNSGFSFIFAPFKSPRSYGAAHMVFCLLRTRMRFVVGCLVSRTLGISSRGLTMAGDVAL